VGALRPVLGARRRHGRRRADLALARLIDGIWITELAVAGEGHGPGLNRLGVKDLFDTAGIRTTYGSAVFANHVPDASAEAVSRLERAGWVNAGKTNLHEFAYGVTSQNLHYGTVPNPARPGLTAGGSSGGSAAALVLGQVEGALGTDTGGSIRIPAACCGIVGFKPSFGLVPIDGVFPLAPSFDHAGPMARDVAGCIALMEALVPGFAVLDVELPDISLATAWDDVPVSGTAIDFPTAANVSPAFMREVGDVHRELYPEQADLYGDNIRGKIERCIALPDEEYDAAVRARAELADRAASALEGHDLLVTPTLACPVPRADVVEVEVRAAMTLYTFPFNALGWPALAIPYAAGAGSLQVVGRAGDDALVLAAGLALEAALR
jgi:aspartyl-tRNA(Asn)/glutamyl-tRNA(Gln) amidotransferase subunit A